MFSTKTLREKCPNRELFLVHIFSQSDWIRRDFSGPYSVGMWENTDQKQLSIWTLFTQRNSQRRLLPNWPLQTTKNSSEYKNISWMVKQLFVRVLVRYFLGIFEKLFSCPNSTLDVTSNNFELKLIADKVTWLLQKQSSIGVLKKRCSKNMQQIYRRTPMPKYDFNKITLRHECFPVIYFWNTFS